MDLDEDRTSAGDAPQARPAPDLAQSAHLADANHQIPPLRASRNHNDHHQHRAPLRRHRHFRQPLPPPPRSARAAHPKKTTSNSKNRSTNTHHLLPSPPRPAGEAKMEKSTGPPAQPPAPEGSSTTSPARPPASPERGKEGETILRSADTTATVFDCTGRRHTPRKLKLCTRTARSGAPLHHTAPKRPPEAKGSGESAGETKNFRVSPSIYCSRG